MSIANVAIAALPISRSDARGAAASFSPLNRVVVAKPDAGTAPEPR